MILLINDIINVKRGKKMKNKKITILALSAAMLSPLTSCNSEVVPSLPSEEEITSTFSKLSKGNVTYYQNAINSTDIIGISASSSSSVSVASYDVSGKQLGVMKQEVKTSALANLDAKFLSGESSEDRTTFYASNLIAIDYGSVGGKQASEQCTYYSPTNGLVVTSDGTVENTSAPIEGGVLANYISVFAQVKTILNNESLSDQYKIMALLEYVSSIISNNGSTEPSDPIEPALLSSTTTDEVTIDQDALVKNIMIVLSYAYGLGNEGNEPTEQEKDAALAAMSELIKMITKSDYDFTDKESDKKALLAILDKLSIINPLSCIRLSLTSFTLEVNFKYFAEQFETLFDATSDHFVELFKSKYGSATTLTDDEIKTLIKEMFLNLSDTITSTCKSLKIQLKVSDNVVKGATVETKVSVPVYDQLTGKASGRMDITAKSSQSFSIEPKEVSVPSYKQ